MEEGAGGRPRWQCHGSDAYGGKLRHERHAEFAIAYAIALPCARKWNQMYKLSKNFW
ncbi:MAG: hypothetical protein ICV54_28070 [Nostoc sp. C3-bin3]|nr:hypothetical protein [Nostoc sp. C3-bin3]